MAIVKAKPFRPIKQRPEHASDPYSVALRKHAPIQIDPYGFPAGALNDLATDGPPPTFPGGLGDSVDRSGYLRPQRYPDLVDAGYPYNQFTDEPGDHMGDLGDEGDTGIPLVDDVHHQITAAADALRLTVGLGVGAVVLSGLAVYFIWPKRNR
jgi:hypothetical protein